MLIDGRERIVCTLFLIYIFTISSNSIEFNNLSCISLMYFIYLCCSDYGFKVLVYGDNDSGKDCFLNRFVVR